MSGVELTWLVGHDGVDGRVGEELVRQKGCEGGRKAIDGAFIGVEEFGRVGGREGLDDGSKLWQEKKRAGFFDLDMSTMKVFGRQNKLGEMERAGGRRKHRREMKRMRLEMAIGIECLVPEKVEENE